MLWMTVGRITGVGRSVNLGTRNNRLEFGGDRRSDLDPGILFLLRLLRCVK